jgi:2-dehydropantoate 2-reductase
MRNDYAFVKKRNSLVLHQGSTIDTCSPVQIYKTSHEIGPVDLVLVALKTTANSQLKELVTPLLDKETSILTVQNGLGSDTLLADYFGAERVLGGLAFIATNRISPGEVKCFHPGSLTLGDYNHTVRQRTQAIAEHFNRAGIKTRIVENLDSARWHKLVWNIPFNGLTIANGAITTDLLCANPAHCEEVRALMKEVQLAASHFGHTITDDFLKQQFDVTTPMGAYKPSSLVDFIAGKEIEIEAIWGEPLRRAQAAGAHLPYLSDLYRRMKTLSSQR